MLSFLLERFLHIFYLLVWFFSNFLVNVLEKLPDKKSNWFPNPHLEINRETEVA